VPAPINCAAAARMLSGIDRVAALESSTRAGEGEIASTRGRNAEETQRFNARAGDLTKGKPLIVLKWRLRLGLRNRGGCAPGSPARDGHRHALIRQGLGADHHSARFRQWGSG
jgi:hypothetical protein